MNYTGQQQEAIIHRGARICVDAGAGSGKTRVLIDRIVHLLETEAAQLDEIVAITFTEKAAAEMRERLRAAFRAKVPRDDPDTAAKWRELERRADHARLGTIHAFCAGVLRENALWLGLDPDVAILTEEETVLLRRDCARRTLQRLFEADDDAALRLAAEYSASQLEQNLSSLLAKPGALEAMLASTPPDAEALARQWRETADTEFHKHLEGLRNDPKLLRFLAKSKRFDGACTNPEDGRENLRQRIIAGFTTIIKGAPPAEVRNILADIAEKHDGASKKNWRDDAAFKAIAKLQTNIKDFSKENIEAPEPDSEIERDAAQHTLDMLALYQQVRDAFEAEKADANGLDFDGLILQTRQALRENEDVRKRCAAGIRFLLIDEFQDTDGGQLEIASLLCGEDKGPDLFVVGDVKQSIYYFRGAEVGVFRGVRENAEKLITLDENFRSLPGVLGFVNDFFSRTQLLRAVEDYAPMRAHRQATEQPCVEFLLSEPDGEDKRSAEDGRRAEARLIAQRIVACCEGPEPLMIHGADGTLRSARYGDFALLFRRMGDVHLYERALQKQHVPYTLVAGAGFYARQEIIDVVNLLKVVLDGWDEVALLGFLRSPMAALSDDSLYYLTRKAPLAAAFASAATLDGKAEAERLDAARALIRRLRAEATAPVAELLRLALDITGYEAVLLDGHHGPRRTANVRKLIQLAESFSHKRPPTLRAYMQYLDALRGEPVREGEAGLQPGGEGGVALMTIHKSKGLEFPVVILPDLGQASKGGRSGGYLLHRELGLVMKSTNPDGGLATPVLGDAITRRTGAEEAAERARVLYVAMTRARDYLICSGGTDVTDGSWLDDFDTAYHVLEREDGAVINGEGWAAHVRKSAGEVKRAAPPEEHGAENLAALLPNTEVLAIAPPRDATWSISAVLDYLAGGFDAGEEGEADVRQVSAGRTAETAMARGSLVHRLFEAWDFSEGPPEIEKLIAGSGVAFDGAAALAGELEALAARFAQSPLGQRMAGEARVLRETPFLLDLGGPLLSGCIDAVLNDGTVIDYKTGGYDADRNARYEWQLLLYAAALRDLGGISPKIGILAYVDADRVHEVPFDEDQINWALRHAREAIGAMASVQQTAG